MWIAWENNYKYMLNISMWSVLQTWARTVFLKCHFHHAILRPKIHQFSSVFLRRKHKTSNTASEALGLPRWLSGKAYPCQAGNTRDACSILVFGKFLCRRKWQLSPVFLLGKSLWHRSLACYSPWGLSD